MNYHDATSDTAALVSSDGTYQTAQSKQVESESIVIGSDIRISTSIMDLPRELRDEIWSLAVRFDEVQVLKPRIQRSRTGRVRLKEPTIALCYAVPTYWNEIRSAYYSYNTLSIDLRSANERDAFRLWIQRRGPLLKGLTGLIIPDYKMHVERWLSYHRKWLKQYTSTKMQLSGEKTLMVRDGSRGYNPRSGCSCDIGPLLQQRLNREPASEDRFTTAERAAAGNSVLEFALKMCRATELTNPDYKAAPEDYSSARSGSPQPCRLCGKEAWIIID